MDLEDLDVRIGNGSIDTVLLALTDMQGRLQGKRLHAHYFMDEVVSGGSEGCNYLLAVDVDMNTVDGYAMSSWSSRCCAASATRCTPPACNRRAPRASATSVSMRSRSATPTRSPPRTTT